MAELAIKGGFLGLSPQFLFTALKQTQIPSEEWTSALLRDQRAETLSLCRSHQLTQSLWCLRRCSLLPFTSVSPHLVGDYGKEGSLWAYSTQMMLFEAALQQPPALLTDTMSVGRG